MISIFRVLSKELFFLTAKDEETLNHNQKLTEQNYPEYPLQEKGQPGRNESSQRRPLPPRKTDSLPFFFFFETAENKDVVTGQNNLHLANNLHLTASGRNHLVRRAWLIPSSRDSLAFQERHGNRLCCGTGQEAAPSAGTKQL